jgi:CarD family transcriptional regulator
MIALSKGGMYMFQVGDKIVYPLHGAAVIHAIEEKEILGEIQNYYIMKMGMGKVQIMIPVEKTTQVGIRLAVDIDTMDNVLLTLHDNDFDSSIAWNHRYRVNADKMRTGDIGKGTEVIRDLTQLNKKRTLGLNERKMLDSAMQILISELVLVKEIDEEQATSLLNQIVYN